MRTLLKKLNQFLDNTLQKIVIALVILWVSFAPFAISVVSAQVFTYGETVTVSAIVGAEPVVEPSGGGIILPQSPVVGFSGYAYPNATIILLKNTLERLQVTADTTGFFSMSISEPFESTSLYALYAQDKEQERSLLLNYPLATTRGVVTQVSGILFAPTISSDKVGVKSGESIEVFGYAQPEKSLVVKIRTEQSEKTYTVRSLSDGKYSALISTLDLPKGSYTITVSYEGDRRASKALKITIGDTTSLRSQDITVIPGDCNKDNLIDLRDFSVAAFWYLRPNPPACVDTNDDKSVDIVDFSILAFYWTG